MKQFMNIVSYYVVTVWEWVNFVPSDKILDMSKLKAFADDNLNMYQKMKFALVRTENIVGKGENAGYQHFLLFPQCFEKASSLGSIKSRLCETKTPTYISKPKTE